MRFRPIRPVSAVFFRHLQTFQILVRQPRGSMHKLRLVFSAGLYLRKSVLHAENVHHRLSLFGRLRQNDIGNSRGQQRKSLPLLRNTIQRHVDYVVLDLVSSGFEVFYKFSHGTSRLRRNSGNVFHHHEARFEMFYEFLKIKNEIFRFLGFFPVCLNNAPELARRATGENHAVVFFPDFQVSFQLLR